MSETTFNIFEDFQCSPTSPTNPGGRGITVWSLGSIPSTIPANGSVSFTFTPSNPDCYDGQNHANDCIVYFYTQPYLSSAYNAIEIDLYLNGQGLGGFRIPGNANYGNRQGYDLAFTSPWQHTVNTLTFSNSSDVNVSLFGEIHSSYSMTNLLDQCEENCSPLTPAGTVGIDVSRLDFPCNYKTGGMRSISYIQGGPYDQHILHVGETFAWTFDFSTFSTDNYKAKHCCLLNFNKMWANSTDPNGNYTTLDAYVNGNDSNAHIATYYLVSHESSTITDDYYPLYPSYDLSVIDTYHDNGRNTITLTNHGPVNVLMCDGSLNGSQGQNVGLNVYRVYETYSASIYVSVAVGSGGGGAIYESGYVAWNSTPTFTITPNSGYQVSSLDVTDFATPPNHTYVAPCTQYTLPPVQKCVRVTAYFSQIPCGVCDSSCQTCFGSCYACVTCQPCEGCQIGCEDCLGCEPCQNCEYACMDMCMYCESMISGKNMATNNLTTQTQQTTNQPTQTANQAQQAGQTSANQTQSIQTQPSPDEKVKQIVMETLIELNLIPKAEKKKEITT